MKKGYVKLAATVSANGIWYVQDHVLDYFEEDTEMPSNAAIEARKKQLEFRRKKYPPRCIYRKHA